MSNCSESVEFKIKFLTDCIRMQRVGLIHRSIDKQTKTCARQYPRIFIPNRYKINLSNLWKMTTYFNLFINSKRFLVNFLYRNHAITSFSLKSITNHKNCDREESHQQTNLKGTN